MQSALTDDEVAYRRIQRALVTYRRQSEKRAAKPRRTVAAILIGATILAAGLLTAQPSSPVEAAPVAVNQARQHLDKVLAATTVARAIIKTARVAVDADGDHTDRAAELVGEALDLVSAARLEAGHIAGRSDGDIAAALAGPLLPLADIQALSVAQVQIEAIAADIEAVATSMTDAKDGGYRTEPALPNNQLDI